MDENSNPRERVKLKEIEEPPIVWKCFLEKSHRKFFKRLFNKVFPEKAILLTQKNLVPLPLIEIEDENEPISKIFGQAMELEKFAYDFYISLS